MYFESVVQVSLGLHHQSQGTGAAHGHVPKTEVVLLKYQL